MGNSSSTPTNFSNEEVIREHMETYASHWNGNGQTELFRTHVPTGVVDFTEKLFQIIDYKHELSKKLIKF